MAGKCVKVGEEIRRVSESEADRLVKLGGVYVSKSEWKKVRLNPVPVQTTAKKKKTKIEEEVAAPDTGKRNKEKDEMEEFLGELKAQEKQKHRGGLKAQKHRG